MTLAGVALIAAIGISLCLTGSAQGLTVVTQNIGVVAILAVGVTSQSPGRRGPILYFE